MTTVDCKRILYICGGRSFYREDLNRKLMEVAKCWERAGHEVKHICGGDLIEKGRNSRAVEYGEQSAHAKWYRRNPIFKLAVTSVSEGRDLLHDRKMFEVIMNECKEWGPEIIWERSSRLHCAGLRLANEMRIPYVLEWKDHLVNYRHSIFHRRALDLEKRKKSDSDYIVVESEVLRRELGSEGIDTGRIIVAHNAVGADEFVQDGEMRMRTRFMLGVQENVILVGYLGSYAFYHDTERLVLATEIIRRVHESTNVKILMVGAGKEYERCRRRAQELKLTDDLLIMKAGVPKEEVPGILAALDIAVLPGSTDIICPIKVQEYMACELPAIIPDYECNREVVKHGETGMLFQPKDQTALADAIVFLAQNWEMRKRMGRCAREEAIRRFSWEATWGAALENVIQRENEKWGNDRPNIAASVA
jgi:glycosyltransferase involved in cell wall biosynthesis